MATLVIGAIFPPANPWVAMIEGVAGAFIDSRIFAQHPTTEGPRMSNKQLTVSAYGNEILKTWGMNRLGGNVIWGTNYVEHRHESTQRVGKGGGSTSTSINYTYSVSVAIGIQAGIIKDIKRVWADGTDITGYFKKLGSISMSGSFKYRSSDGNFVAADSNSYYKIARFDNNLSASSTQSVSISLTCKWRYGKRCFQVSYGSESYGYCDIGKDFTITDVATFNISKKTSDAIGSENTEWEEGNVITISNSNESIWGSNGITDDVMKYGCSRTTDKLTFTLYPGSEVQEPNSLIQSIEGTQCIPGFRGLSYIVLKDFDVSAFGNRLPQLSFETVTDGATVGNIVQYLSKNAGLTDDKLDISASLYGMNIQGFSVGSSSSFRDKIQTLMNVKDFFAVERNGRVVFELNDRSSNYRVPNGDLGAKEGNDPDDHLYVVERKHDMELPKGAKISYTAYDKDYQVGTMDAYRPNVRSKLISSIDGGIVMSDAEAKSVIEGKLYEAWARRSTVSLTLPMRWAFLTPGDTINYSINGVLQGYQISKTTFNPVGTVDISGTKMVNQVYQQIDRTTDASVASPVQKEPTKVKAYILDLPMLPTENSNDCQHFYAVASADVFFGANLMNTFDDGASWNLAVKITRCCTMGTVQQALNIGQSDFFDYSQTLTVQLDSGTLESRPMIDILNGYNSAIIGDEIVQYLNVELVADKKYILSGLLRGRMGTEDKIAGHSQGERFIVIDYNTISIVKTPISSLYSSRKYKYGPSTKPYTDGSYVDTDFTYNARNLKPWSVCNVRWSADSNNNWNITWNRRDRTGGAWLDNSDIVMSESSQAFEVDIYKNGNVIRTISTNDEGVCYTSAMQNSDFGGHPSSFKMVIYQLSQTVGRGIPKEVQLS